MTESYQDNVEQTPVRQIRQEQFSLYEAVILTEQMPAGQVPRFMQENPEFFAWYRARRALVSG